MAGEALSALADELGPTRLALRLDYRISHIELDVFTFTFNAKGHVPLGRFQPYAMLGIGGSVWDSNVTNSDSGFAARFGFGLDYYLTQNWALNTGWSYVTVTGDIDGLDYHNLMFGAQYRF